VDINVLVDYLENATPANMRRQLAYANRIKKNWIAQELTGSDAVAFIMAKNTIITALEKPKPRRLSSDWELAGIDLETGKVMWKQRLPSSVLPGSVLVDRYGRIIVVHEDGSVSCLG